jgi:hypothetical protein
MFRAYGTQDHPHHLVGGLKSTTTKSIEPLALFDQM